MKKALVIGSGPIVIGQSAEFDYSGTQACRALREEGIEVVLVNSNPATIQTDKETADRIYIEPLTFEVLERIIEKERPEGILATVGGQTGLNLAMELKKKGVLEKFDVEFLGTDAEAIERAESREEFNRIMNEIGVPVLPGEVVNDFESAQRFAEKIGYPVIIRPSFTLGGTGGGVAKDGQQLKEMLGLALRLSMTGEALIEKSGIGWGEFEYEVLRDGDGNSVIICNMENVDPMGIHTGESIVVAPSQTLSDQDHQRLRDAAIRIVNAIGIKGGCNVQFAFNQDTGEYAVIEVNPRLSRSSALASKATGYPIARIATKIALGYRLHEIKNPITGTSAAFEPALDYIVTKIPRWPFDKFSRSDRRLGTQMKSTGEVMAIGRTFGESFMKAVRSLDVKIPLAIKPEWHLYPATDQRLFALFEAFRRDAEIEEIYEKTKINRWFLRRIKTLVGIERELEKNELTKELLLKAKREGISDRRIGELKSKGELEVRKLRKEFGVIPAFKVVDSCAGEFEALTPYYYSTYGVENEAQALKGKSVVVLGSGPIRIGQGIEFDYCCSHAAFALKEMGIKSIIINNNPETVSTDFDSSNRLYFEPLVFEDVMNVIENETPDGVIVQLGGQTSINLAEKLEISGVKILGTSVESIDIAEDRERFRHLADKLGIPQPKNMTAKSGDEAFKAAKIVGYPLVVRPSYVIAGRGMEIVRDENELSAFLSEAIDVSENRPILIDKYMDNAIECEVDCVADGDELFIGGIMEHVEPAGIHSGDANIALPSLRLGREQKEKIVEYSERFANALNAVGFMNIQYVVKDGTVYVLEVNPRASRTVPFVSKAINVPLAKLATRAMLGEKIGGLRRSDHSGFAVKSVVFPFLKLGGTDTKLGPEMRSTGETMGIGRDFETAYYKALLAAGINVKKRAVFLSLRDEDKKLVPELAGLLDKLGFEVYGTGGTVSGIKNAKIVHKIMNGQPDVLEIINSDRIGLVVNTPRKGGSSNTDGFKIRRLATEKGIPCITDIQTAFELLKALIRLEKSEMEIRELNEYSGVGSVRKDERFIIDIGE